MGLDDHYDKRKKNGTENVITSQVPSRRRAQNRASQQAFRDRKAKHMRDLEQRLSELENRHNDLTRSYESLQVELSNAKSELDWPRKENVSLRCSSTTSTMRYNLNCELEESNADILDPHLFDISLF
ncbi:hypothetical protein B0O99DRAFT_743555 [Bisporella sp. PMI_857]|nr:hypothetical protein B0O99DRAFT_743555 [Bisporella sp. PMI_857]